MIPKLSLFFAMGWWMLLLFTGCGDAVEVEVGPPCESPPDSNPRCPVHVCAQECGNLDAALSCCLAIEEEASEQALCLAQVHGLEPGIWDCYAIPSEVFRPPPEPDRWTVMNITTTPCTGGGVSGDSMHVSLSNPGEASRGGYNKLVMGGCEPYWSGDWPGDRNVHSD